MKILDTIILMSYFCTIIYKLTKTTKQKRQKKNTIMTAEQQRIQDLEKLVEELKKKPLSVVGIVRFIDPTKDVSKTDKPFLTRNLCLDTSVDINGTRYESFVGFQMTGEKCKLLDEVNVNDKIEVFFSIRATVKASDKDIKSEKNPKGELCFSNLTAYNLAVLSKASAAPTSSGDAAASTASKPVKPDVIHDGKEWDEEKGCLVDKLPF